MTRWKSVIGRYRVTADPLRTERRVELVAVALGLLLCLQLLYSGARLLVASAPDVVAPAADVLQVKPALILAGVATDQSDEIRARPLFWQGRRPLVAVPVAAVAPVETKKDAAKLKGVKLLGVFGSGDTAGIIALVKKKKTRILQGESIEGWTLESVEPNRIVLVDGGRREELVLLPGKIEAVAPPPIPASALNEPVKGPVGGNAGAKNDDLINKQAAPIPRSERRMGVRGSATAETGK